MRLGSALVGRKLIAGRDGAPPADWLWLDINRIVDLPPLLMECEIRDLADLDFGPFSAPCVLMMRSFGCALAEPRPTEDYLILETWLDMPVQLGLGQDFSWIAVMSRPLEDPQAWRTGDLQGPEFKWIVGTTPAYTYQVASQNGNHG